MGKTLDEFQVLQIARVLGDPVRFSIYRHILEIGEVRCGDICIETPVRASTTSHHLKMLCDVGLITSRREGQGVYYRPVPSTMQSFVGFLRDLRKEPFPGIRKIPAKGSASNPMRKEQRAAAPALAAHLR